VSTLVSTRVLNLSYELFDRKLANHLVSLYYKSSEQEQQEMLVSTLGLG